MKIDVNDASRFWNVLKVLSKKLPLSTDINGVYKDFLEKERELIPIYGNSNNKGRKKLKNIHHNGSGSAVAVKIDHEFMLERIEVLKKSYCNYLNRVVGVKKRP